MSDTSGYGNNGSMWRSGAVRELDHDPTPAPSCFPEGSFCRAFLSEEARVIAEKEALPRLEWYNVFVGDLFCKALVDAQLSKTQSLEEASKKISIAASIDAMGRQAFYTLAATSGEMAYIVKSADSYELTAAVACYAIESFLAGSIPMAVYTCPICLIQNWRYTEFYLCLRVLESKLYRQSLCLKSRKASYESRGCGEHVRKRICRGH